MMNSCKAAWFYSERNSICDVGMGSARIEGQLSQAEEREIKCSEVLKWTIPLQLRDSSDEGNHRSRIKSVISRYLDGRLCNGGKSLTSPST
jgi:hypothetical protein